MLTTGTQWVDFIKEPYGNVVASFGETQRTDENKEQNHVTTVCKGLRLFCKRLQLFCKRLQLFANVCGKINSQRNFEHVQNFFATRKTVYNKENCLRSFLQPFTTFYKLWRNPKFATFASIRRSVR